MSYKWSRLALAIFVMLMASCSPAASSTSNPTPTPVTPLHVYLSPETRWLGEFLNKCSQIPPYSTVLVIDREVWASIDPDIRFYLGDTGSPAPVSYLISQEPLSVAVSAGSPVTTLTSALIADIYTGKLQNWGDLSESFHALGPVSALDYPDPASLHLALMYFIGSPSGNTYEVPSIQAMQEQLSSDPAAVGYLLSRELSSSLRSVVLETPHPFTLPLRAESSAPLSTEMESFLVCIQDEVRQSKP